MVRTKAVACDGKQKHPDRASALAHVFSLARGGAAMRMLTAYRCKHCRAYHVGHRLGEALMSGPLAEGLPPADPRLLALYRTRYVAHANNPRTGKCPICNETDCGLWTKARVELRLAGEQL